MVQQHLLPAARLLILLYTEERGPFSCTSPASARFFLGAISDLCGCQAVTSDRFGPHVQAERCELVEKSDDGCIFGITGNRQKLV